MTESERLFLVSFILLGIGCVFIPKVISLLFITVSLVFIPCRVVQLKDRDESLLLDFTFGAIAPIIVAGIAGGTLVSTGAIFNFISGFDIYLLFGSYLLLAVSGGTVVARIDNSVGRMFACVFEKYLLYWFETHELYVSDRIERKEIFIVWLMDCVQSTALVLPLQNDYLESGVFVGGIDENNTYWTVMVDRDDIILPDKTQLFGYCINCGDQTKCSLSGEGWTQSSGDSQPVTFCDNCLTQVREQSIDDGVIDESEILVAEI